MADITKCNLEECPMKDSCYRYQASDNNLFQSYFLDPYETCYDNHFSQYWKMNNYSKESIFKG